jgi:hypothetical protein
MLHSELIYNIKNLLSGGKQSDDQFISDRQLAFIINYYRAKLFKEDEQKGRFNKELYIQNLGKVTLIKADKNECTCEIDSCILRTEFKIPIPLETKGGINITFVGLLNGKPFTKTYHNVLPWKRASKYTGKLPKYYYQNGYIYIIDPPTSMMTYINIQGIFEVPEKAINFRTCDCPQNNEDCFSSFDYDYPLPQHHVDTVVKLISQTEIRLLMAIPTSTTNNSMDQISELLSKTKQ